jgi:hypothetical protein
MRYRYGSSSWDVVGSGVNFGPFLARRRDMHRSMPYTANARSAMMKRMPGRHKVIVRTRDTIHHERMVVPPMTTPVIAILEFWPLSSISVACPSCARAECIERATTHKTRVEGNGDMVQWLPARPLLSFRVYTCTCVSER